MNSLKAINLCKSYETNNESVDVLDEINLTIGLHDQIAISGNSGSGKSTLLHLLAALDSPTSGSILIDDCDIAEFSKVKLSQHRLENFGFVYQFHHLLEDLTVIENILIPGQLANKNSNLKDSALELAEMIGLSHRLNHLPWKLSGGEKQRVAVARAMINKPDFIFLDEPTGNLDKQNAENIQELVINLCHENDVAIVVATHDNDFVNILDRKYILDKRGLIEL